MKNMKKLIIVLILASANAACSRTIAVQYELAPNEQDFVYLEQESKRNQRPLNYQQFANTVAAEIGIRPRRVVKACTWHHYDQGGFSGLADLEQDILVICPSGNLAHDQFVIAHELGHFHAYDNNGPIEGTEAENYADYIALSYFGKKGEVSPIQARARSANTGEYRKGAEAARWLLGEH